jgi:hypothetical protein
VTRLEMEIGDVVLRGVPAAYGASFGTLVEERINTLARGESLEPGAEDPDDERSLADLVAHQVWDEVRRSTEGVWGGRP